MLVQSERRRAAGVSTSDHDRMRGGSQWSMQGEEEEGGGGGGEGEGAKHKTMEQRVRRMVEVRKKKKNLFLV